MRILLGVLALIVGMLLSIEHEPHTYVMSSKVQTDTPQIKRHYYPPEP
tara:strand:- start:6999 stop:7142 length:144 start_codon:yes stop_codon:yes gene_type:complete